MSAGLVYGGLAAYQIYAAHQTAELIREGAKLTNRVNKMNAEAKELEAFEAEKMGYTRSSRYANVINQTLGQQTVIFAAQGTDTSSGTAAAIQAETKLVGALNQADMIKEASLRARGIKSQADNIRLNMTAVSAQAALNASNAIVSGYTGAASTALAGYSSGSFGAAGKTTTDTSKPAPAYGSAPSGGPTGYRGGRYTLERVD